MCGIVGYVGPQEATPLLVEGLKRLEYRGYDSAGVAVQTAEGVRVTRSVGRVGVLEEKLAVEANAPAGGCGIAHTRWATHGEVTEDNAHPHHAETAEGTRIVLVHNGTIENYAALRTYLTGKGWSFYSSTDTEVLAKLIAELYEDDLEAAVRSAMHEVTGAYAIAVMCDREPDTLVAARC